MAKRRAFTLIELLVVIAIIAILMSILMPALQKVREQARAIACMANQKNMALGYIMYADGNDGSMPGDRWSQKISGQARVGGKDVCHD